VWWWGIGRQRLLAYIENAKLRLFLNWDITTEYLFIKLLKCIVNGTTLNECLHFKIMIAADNTKIDARGSIFENTLHIVHIKEQAKIRLTHSVFTTNSTAQL
jgi:hypothetical protein